MIAPPARPNSASYALVLMFTVSIASADGISVVSSPVRWLSSIPSIWTLFARRDWPLTFARQAVLRVEEVGVRPLHPQGARHRDHHPLEVAVEAERHLRQMDAFDDAAGVGAVGLQQRALADDGDRLFDGADLHLQIDARCRIHRHLDAVAHRALEAAQLRGHAVLAVLEVRKHVVAGGVRHRRVRDVGVHLGDRHGDAGQREPGLIDDVAEQTAFHRLRSRGDAAHSRTMTAGAAQETSVRVTRRPMCASSLNGLARS